MPHAQRIRRPRRQPRGLPPLREGLRDPLRGVALTWALISEGVLVVERLHNLGGGWYVLALEDGDVELQLRHEDTGCVVHRRRLNAREWATMLADVAKESPESRAALLHRFLRLHLGEFSEFED